MNELSRGGRLGAQIARWMLGRPNILALSPSLVHWFWKSREGLNAPDLQGVFTPASYREGYIGMLDDYPGMTCGVWQHRPESVGYVHARSSNPFQDPIVQPNYLEDPRDQQVLLGGMRVARRLMQTPELAKFFDTETLPGKGVTTDDELLDYARQRWRVLLPRDGYRADGPVQRSVGRCRRRTAGPRRNGIAGRGCLGHAQHAVREHLRLDHDDRREGGRHDQGLAPSSTRQSPDAATPPGATATSDPSHQTVRGAQMKAIELQRCARVAIETCGSVRPKERVLIVTDTMRDQSVAQCPDGGRTGGGCRAGAHGHADAA